MPSNAMRFHINKWLSPITQPHAFQIVWQRNLATDWLHNGPTANSFWHQCNYSCRTMTIMPATSEKRTWNVSCEQPFRHSALRAALLSRHVTTQTSLRLGTCSPCCDFLLLGKLPLFHAHHFMQKYQKPTSVLRCAQYLSHPASTLLLIYSSQGSIQGHTYPWLEQNMLYKQQC